LSIDATPLPVFKEVVGQYIQNKKLQGGEKTKSVTTNV
jgi:hypothetical protein